MSAAKRKQAQGLCAFITKYAKTQGVDASAGITADGRMRVSIGKNVLEFKMENPLGDAKIVEQFIREAKGLAITIKPPQGVQEALEGMHERNRLKREEARA